MPVLPMGRALLEPADMTDKPNDPPDSDQDTSMHKDKTPDIPGQNIVHFNPWRDFNDAAPQIDVFGDAPDPAQIAQFMQIVFDYCDGLIPVRSFIDKGQGIDGRPHNIWLDADQAAPEKMATFATWAAREGAAVYVIPGTVAASGQARAAEILQMQTVGHLGAPTMVVESGGVTPEGQRKAHVWWKLTEPAVRRDRAFHPYGPRGPDDEGRGLGGNLWLQRRDAASPVARRTDRRRGRATFRLPRECRPSSRPRFSRSRRRTGQHGL